MIRRNLSLSEAKKANVCNIVALRGDPPKGEEWQAIEGGFTCALDLVNHIKKYIQQNFH